MILRSFWLLLLIPVISGCLRTRSDVDRPFSGNVPQEQVLNVETVDTLKANYSMKIDEMELELRKLNGKLEEIERRLVENGIGISGIGEGGSGGYGELIKQNRVLISSIVELKARLSVLESGTTGGKVQDKDNPFSGAEELFRQQKWSEAIIEYEKYRGTSEKKDDRWAEATYKIGLCFQKMNLNREARSFYEEVISNSPNSPVSVMAKKQLQSL